MQTIAIQTDSRGLSALLFEQVAGGGARLVESTRVAAGQSPADSARAVRDGLGGRGGRGQVCVALGPERAKARRLAVPPAPPEELPSLVAMQAARDASDAGEIVADYVPPKFDSPDGPNQLLTAWAAEEEVSWWREFAAALGGKLAVLAPRPLASLALAAGTAPVLVVTRAGDSLDFVAATDSEPQLLRSTKAAAESASVQREVLRTRLSLNELAGLESARLVGDHEEPIDWASLPIDTSALGEQSPSEFAAAIGLALAASSGHTPVLNLAEPRRAAQADTGRRRQVLLAAAAAVVLLAGGWMAYERIARLDREIANLQKQIAAAEDDVEAFEPFRERVAAIDAWRESDVTWLDEVERLGRELRPELLASADFEAESDVRVTQVIATALVGGDTPGGRVQLSAESRDSSTALFESRYRDDLHDVEPLSLAESQNARDAYRYQYTAVLTTPADVQEPTPDPPAPAAEPTTVDASPEPESDEPAEQEDSSEGPS